MTPEAKVKKQCRALLDARGAYYHATITSGYGKGGAPDLLCCVYGYFLGVECKAGDNKPTALQGAALKAIREAGGYAIVVNETNQESLKNLLDLLQLRKK